MSAFQLNDFALNAVSSGDLVKFQRDPMHIFNINCIVTEYGSTYLIIASDRGRANIVAYLLEKDALVDKPDNNGATPLHYAAVNNHVKVIRLLLEGGATVDKPDNNGVTPLYYAADNNHVEAIRLLLEGGATVDKPDKNGGTQL